jgi:hypothetical protein
MSLLCDLSRASLISPSYLDEQRILHAAPRGYGGKGDKWASGVAHLVKSYSAWSVLDYGAGRGSLALALGALLSPAVRISEYDPAVPRIAALPGFADLVVCTDVLEHIEPDRLDAVLAHLKMLARKAVFVVIATRPSNKTLSDGRNAHLILEQDAWWVERLLQAGFQVSPGPVSPSVKPSREFVAVLTS